MKKSWKEYKREWRKEQKQKAAAAGDPTDAIATLPFDQYFFEAPNWSIADESLASVGIEAPTFDADTDDGWSKEWGTPYRASIGRAERMVGAFLDAATELSNIINAYKRKQITDKLEEIENTVFHDPFESTKADKDRLRLKIMLNQLDKQVRWTFPQWRVTGE